jgi:dolichyl-phosphate beta-glucosyltransferase
VVRRLTGAGWFAASYQMSGSVSTALSSAPFLSIIVPAYNEVRSIGGTLLAIRAHLEARGLTHEIIVSADGDDGTRELVGKMALEDPRLRVIGESRRGGKGRGIREGVARARGQVIGFVDADYKTPIEALDRLLPVFDEGFDLVIGSRAMEDSRIERQQSMLRRVGSRAFGLAMHAIIGLRGIRDTQCGFKFFRGEVARDLFSRQRVDGYMFDVEVLHLAVRSGYRIKEVGVRWRDDGDSRLQLVAGNWRNMLDILKIRFSRYPARPEAAVVPERVSA